MNLRRLIYFSSAVGPMETEQLDDLLMQSRRNNLCYDLTGLLLYGDGSFMQLLEGPDEWVEQIYGRILRDSRHRNLLEIDYSLRSERQFSEWSMAFRRIKGGQQLDGFLSLHKAILRDTSYRPDGDVADYMVRSFLFSINEHM
jgi:hypothetical protein